MAKRNYYYVLVFTNGGPVYVTSVNKSQKISYWDDEKKPYEFGSMSYARDIAIGLGLNGTNCVAVSSAWELDSQPYRYSEFDCTFTKKEQKN